ncbi:dsdna-dependent atpase [Diplodia corticola]|uniref:Dsdna-dependent atpase n=1 Tax=Diplodia corticola TaxID=236234 RepID=A0A1J9QPC5_9PEZI|nr:dsdna-dependent atpase [Diplodia corticola]OJD30766.1 dsdna-dependent atpase [Diplodia corticola]
MLNKPFKPPALIRKPSESHPIPGPPVEPPSAPPSKKRRISYDNDDPPRPSPAPVPARKPLLQVVNPARVDTPYDDTTSGYYTVLWRKPTAKKHKTWDGDAILCLSNGYAQLQDTSGRPMGKTMWSKPLEPGSTLSVGGKELEVDAVISKQDFLAGRHVLSANGPVAPKPAVTQSSNNKPLLTVNPTQVQKIAVKSSGKPDVGLSVPASTQSRPPTSKFRNPLLTSTTLPKQSNTTMPQARHDPDAPGALVMKRPLPMHIPRGKQAVDVVVDPVLSKHLRDHQRQGVQFLYECVMGFGAYNGRGAILADEMGLGKTLQTITLVWTLLKQNFVYDDPPAVKKAIIVCPAGVVSNWRKEFRKWLGIERLGVFVADEPGKRLTDFTRGKCYNVMVIGYEKLLKSHEDIKKHCNVDLIVLDEGHKLKTAKGKTAQAIRNLGTDRIVLLSGTPFSNNLLEFHTVADLVNPGIFGKLNAFKREFDGPIVRGQQPDATAKEREKGTARYEELDKLSKQFMLRRTADILSKYLPPKTEHVLLCRPTAAQAQVYRSVLASPAFGAALGSNENALQLINILKQVCNSPKLLSATKKDESPNPVMAAILEAIPSKLLNSRASAKLHVLDGLLHRIRTTTDEKVVLVSHYTSTLNILEELLNSLSYTCLRIDGSTPASKRQEMINKFNNSNADRCFVFLLSAKAGGVGINLIGASRLVLYDIDWNPAHDLQAMARIHRDGQKRPCRIYRLLTMGALDEKIFQRQVTKQGLADSVIDSKSSSASFTKEELRDLFTLNDDAECQTHRLICCPCGGRGNGGGLVPAAAAAAAAAAADENGGAAKDSASETTADDDDDDDDAGNDDDAGDGDSEDDLPDLPTLLRASQVDMEGQEKRLSEARRAPKGEKAKMVSLMQYAHVDTSLISGCSDGLAAAAAPSELVVAGPSGDGHAGGEQDVVDFEALIDDEPLMDVIKEEGSRVRFVFSKTSS